MPQKHPVLCGVDRRYSMWRSLKYISTNRSKKSPDLGITHAGIAGAVRAVKSRLFNCLAALLGFVGDELTGMVQTARRQERQSLLGDGRRRSSSLQNRFAGRAPHQ